MNAMLFLSNLAYVLPKILGKAIANQEPSYGWIHYERTGEDRPVTIERIHTANNGSTLVSSFAVGHTARNHKTGNLFRSWETKTIGISIRDEGPKMWAQFARGKARSHFSVTWNGDFEYAFGLLGPRNVLRLDEHWGEKQAITERFVRDHGASSIPDLIIPSMAELSDGEDDMVNYRRYSSWMLNAMSARDQRAFWNKLCPRIKLTRDEKKVILSRMPEPMAFYVARLASLVKIPNLRDVEFGDNTLLHVSMKEVKADAKHLRMIAPHRRLAVLNAILTTPGYRMYNDTFRFINNYINGGGVVELPINARSLRELHDRFEPIERARARQRMEEFRTWQNEERQKRIEAGKKINEKALGLNGTMIGDSGIEVVVTDDVMTIVGWGDTQHHCIGSYARDMAEGATLLMGFRRDEEWVGHCSIQQGHCTQLLAKYNASVPEADRAVILDWLVENELITEAKVGWF